MFTGIIEELGVVAEYQPCDGDLRLFISTSQSFLSDVSLGDSIACNGVCLTAVDISDAGFWADVSQETLANTTIPKWQVKQKINLEKAMLASSRLGGHIVSGHVDGVAEVTSRKADARSEQFSIQVSAKLAKYIAHKGSVTVDGTSLTVNKVDGDFFEVNIVPHTLENTVIGSYQAGTKVNLEVDVIARYLERLVQGQIESKDSSTITSEMLNQHGYLKSS
ncbi:riboflavin synthase [Aurantivibrio infirmus]